MPSLVLGADAPSLWHIHIHICDLVDQHAQHRFLVLLEVRAVFSWRVGGWEGWLVNDCEVNEDGLSTFQEIKLVCAIMRRKGIHIHARHDAVPELGEFCLCLSVQVRSLGAAGSVFLKGIRRSVQSRVKV